jgi:hypothetical protein
MAEGAAPTDADSKVIINISFGNEKVTFEKERVAPLIDVTPTRHDPPD